MKACKNVKRQFIDALEGTLTDEQRLMFEKHLSTCPACKTQFQQLLTLNTDMQQVQRPQKEEKYWDRYWLQILSQVMEDERSHTSPQLSFSFGKIAQQALATAAILVISFGIFWVHKQTSQPINPAAVSLPMNAVVQDYLEQSKLLLMGIVNMDDHEKQESVNFTTQRQVSEELVMQSALLRKNIEMQNDHQLLDLLEELEIIMLQIANTDSTNNTDALDLIQYSVEQNSILFKINMEQVLALEKKNANQKEI